jgi:quinohemoprotein amine dehydrogenase beta subunit
MKPAGSSLFAAFATAALLSTSGTAAARDYLLAGVKPDQLVLVDPAARKVERTYKVRDGFPGPWTIVPSPDGKRAYVVANRWESVAGIDLESGQEVFRADFSALDQNGRGERAKALAVDVTPDGRELFVFLSAVRIDPDEYQVEDARIAVYRTSDGTQAKPVRTIPAPRRTSLLAFSRDGSKLYAFSWDVVVLDPVTGKEIGRHPVRHWNRPGYGEPDVLDFWPQWEATGVVVALYTVARTDVPPTDPGAARTGLLSLDLASGSFTMEDFENATTVIFSGVVNPARPTEAFLTYATLTKLDRERHKVLKRVDLTHTYYAINIASDGSEVYVGGAMDDIGVYSPDTLKRIGTIPLPGGGDQALASLRLIRR